MVSYRAASLAQTSAEIVPLPRSFAGNRNLSGGSSSSADGSFIQVQNDGTYTYQYDDEGNQIRRTSIATGEVTEYQWDYRNRLVKVVQKDGPETVTKTVEYGYDVFDRRVAKTVTLPSVPTVPLGAVNMGIAVADGATGTGYLLHSRENLFTRFAANPPYSGNSAQLIGVRYNDNQWQYNNNSIWIAFTPVATDRLLASVDFDADTVTSLQGATGDVHGIAQGFADGDLVFWADRWNGSPNDGEFTIQGTWFTLPGETEYYVYDGQHVALRFENGSLTNRYLYGDIVDMILADEQVGNVALPGEVLWPLADQLGSVRDLSDNNGRVREHLVYHSFGQRLSESDWDANGNPIASDNPAAVDHLFGYTGRDWDDDTQLQYNRARWYDPAQGRWISQDPIGFAAGDVNLYRYVGNDATGATDPSGLEHLPADHRGRWVEGSRGNGVFEYADTPQNRLASLCMRTVEATRRRAKPLRKPIRTDKSSRKHDGAI